MGNDLLRWMGNEEGEGSQLERYMAPPSFSKLGKTDRRNEGRHVLHMRQLERETQEAIAGEAKEAIRQMAELERRGRVNEEAKRQLLRATNASQVMAGDNPVLRAQYDIMDSEMFQSTRVQILSRPYRF